MTTRKRSAFALAAGLAVAGCFSAGDGGGCGTGLVGNGNFNYVCVSKVDAHCDGSTGAPVAMPSTVALGSRFRIQFQDVEHEVAGGVVKAVSEKAIKSDGSGFTTLRAGRVGFVAYDGEQAVDAIRLNVVAPRRIAIGVSDDVSPVTHPASDAVSITEATSFAVQPLDEFGAPLAGTLVPERRVDDPTIATVTDRGDGTCVVVAERSGRTRLRVAAASLEDSIGIEVGDPSPSALDGGGGDGGEGEGDADSVDGGGK